jgi:DNA-binding SARP family transcriptional activator/Tfp pilus assembly protein PilF/TolB-like protein
MIRLRVLGGAVLERDGAPLRGRAAQNHHLALLAFLAVAPGRTASRDRLIGVLWPEVETARARHRLSVALHILRQGLGGDVLITSGDSVTLNGAAIETDVGDFLDAVAGGRIEDAVASYAGSYLGGFYLSGSPDFEQWVDGERSRLEGFYRSALERLASEAEEAGELDAAIGWRRRLALLAPYEASAAVALMRAFAARGDLAGALAHARAHTARVEGELGIPVSPKVKEFLDELSEALRLRRVEESDRRSRVPTLAADVEPASSEPVTPSIPAGPTPSETPRRPAHRRVAAWAVVAPMLLLASVSWGIVRAGDAGDATEDASVAIASFEVLAPPDASMETLGADLAEAIRATLAYVPNLRVSETVARVGATSDAARVGRQQGVARVVAGTIGPAASADSVLAIVRLTNTRSGEVEWEGRYVKHGYPKDVLIELLSLAIADDLRLRVAPYLPHHYTSSVAANDEFLAGVFEHRKITEESLWVAIQHYRRATERDPTFALAWAIMGNAYMSLPARGIAPEVGFEQARGLIARALELDPELAEGYATLARLQLFWDRDFAGAEQSLRRAFMLYPTHPDGREWYGRYLLFYRGDADGAIRSLRRALELDPLNTARSRAVENILYMARRFEDIPAQSRHTWSLSTDVAATIQGPFLADGYREMGRYDDAIREYLSYKDRLGVATPAGLAITYARMGREEEARAILREWESSLGTGRYRALAIIHAALGEVDEAIAYLERVFEVRPTGLLSLRVDAVYDPLRSDPRFDDLVRRMGLDQ